MAMDDSGGDAVEQYRNAKRELRVRIAGLNGGNPEDVALSFDYHMRLVAEVVQTSVLQDRERWLNTLVGIVKAGECRVDPFDQSSSPATAADAVVKLLAIYARIIGDDIFREAEDHFPRPTWDDDREEMTVDAGREFLHDCQIRCRGIWIETTHPTTPREEFDGGIGMDPVDPWAMVPEAMAGLLSLTALAPPLERWMELGFRKVFGDEPAAELGPAGAESNGVAPLAKPEPAAAGESDGDQVAHSPDFRSVKWGDENFSFTEMQAVCVRALMDSRRAKMSGLGQSEILKNAESSCTRLRDVFRRNGQMHPAWKTMIVEGDGKGLYRLSDPPA